MIPSLRSPAVLVSWTSLIALLFFSNVGRAQTRDQIVRGDKQKVESEGFWIYNDLDAAFSQAERTGKPIVVVLRCLPCHECVKLDDDLVDTHPVIRPLLEKFVCVRQVSTNGLDLDLFQYDTDQSFAVFFLRADKTIYGRFGTRSHRTEWMGDVSLTGLGVALERALTLHENFDRYKASLAGKRGKPLEFTSPELYPSLKDKFTDSLNYEGDVVKSCIHCHQIGDARRDFYWLNHQPIPDNVLWPYPHPKVLGMIFDPNTAGILREVQPDSIAASSGLQPGDEVMAVQGQPIISIADVQWVLHQTDARGGSVRLRVRRNGKMVDLSMSLPSGWRKGGDLSWRVTTWGLRRIAGGGMVLEESDQGLQVKRVGRYGPHGAAKRAGIREGDVLVSFDGRDDFQTEQAVLTYVAKEKEAGDRVDVVVQRKNKQLNFTLPIQE